MLGGGRDPVRLRRYFEALALGTAGAARNRTIYEAAGIDRRTACIVRPRSTTHDAHGQFTVVVDAFLADRSDAQP